MSQDRWFVGVLAELKKTSVDVELATSSIPVQSTIAEAPIPALGGIGRVYVVPNVSITGELVGIKLPESIREGYRAHYVDFDLYGTVNFNKYAGAQVGYRRIDVGYTFKKDQGTFLMKGLYFGGVVRYLSAALRLRIAVAGRPRRQRDARTASRARRRSASSSVSSRLL